MPIRNFEYGLREPTVNSALVHDQMRLAHRYRNVLVEIERERRDAVRVIMAAHPDLAPLEARMAVLVAAKDAAREVIMSARKVARKRAETPEQRAEVRRLSGEVRALREDLRAAKKVLAQDVGLRAAMDAATERANQRVRDARALCGVYWGTYLLQEADANQARMERTPPRFQRWEGEGRVSAQLQHGLSADNLWGNDTRVRVAQPAPAAFDPGVRRGDRLRAMRTMLKLRVGSEGRAPVWAEWPMIMHRPLPPGSSIKVVTVHRRRRDCRRWNWHVVMTVDVPETALRPAPSSGVVALNLGFCKRPDGTIRVGYLVGDDGHEEEVCVPMRVLTGLDKANAIRSVRDKNMDAMRAALTAWLPALDELHQKLVALITESLGGARDAFKWLGRYLEWGGDRLAWLRYQSSHVHAWRSADRFRRLAFAWRERRFAGDNAGYELLEAWRYRDEHLERYETGLRDTTLRNRREGYRLVAARIAKRYRVLVVDDTKLSEFQRSPAPESETPELAAVKYQQRVAAGSILRRSMVDAFSASRVVVHPAAHMTARCSACGVSDEWNRATPARRHMCTGCGAEWDLDANNCQNHLREYARAIESGDAERDAKAAVPKLSRHQRLRGTRRPAQPEPPA